MPGSQYATDASVITWFNDLNIKNNATVILFLILFVAVLIWTWSRARHHKRWYFWPLPLALPIILLAAAAAANVYFGLYTRMGDLYGAYPFPTASIEQVQNPQGQYARGISVQTDIPGTKSGVESSPALVWLPPQYFTEPEKNYPVVYLYPGSPGGFTDWTLGGNAIRTGQASAANGQPVIIVSPSVGYTELSDTECVNGVQGNWQDYLAQDVPGFVNANFRTLTGPRGQAVAGLSMGGYCAQVLALRNPQTFGFFGNFSGSTMPTYDDGMGALFGPVENLDETVNSYTSTWIIENQPASRSVAGQIYIGRQDDTELITDEQQFTKAATELGMTVDFIQFDGNHSFYFWTTAFEKFLPWLVPQLERPHRSAVSAQQD